MEPCINNRWSVQMGPPPTTFSRRVSANPDARNAAASCKARKQVPIKVGYLTAQENAREPVDRDHGREILGQRLLVVKSSAPNGNRAHFAKLGR